MCEIINNIKYCPRSFYGTINLNRGGLLNKAIKFLIYSILKEGGLVIIEYTNPKDLIAKKDMLRDLDVSLDRLIFTPSIKQFPMWDNNKMYDEYISNRDTNDKVLFIGKRDGNYNKWDIDEIYKYNNTIKDMCIKKGIMSIIEYKLEGLREDIFRNIIDLHDNLIISSDMGIYHCGNGDYEKIKILGSVLKGRNSNEEQLFKEKKKFQLLNELIIDISYKHNKEDLFNSAVSSVGEIIGADFGHMVDFYPLNYEKLVGRYNFPHGLEEYLLKIPMDRREVSRYYSDKNSRDITIRDPEYYENEMRKYILKKYKLKTVIEIPITKDEEVPIGGIYLFSKKECSMFFKHIPFLRAVRNALFIILKKQRKNEEEQNRLIKTEKLKSLGELAGGIAHDFNNVLTTILGISQIALSKNLDNDTKKYLDIIYKSALDGKSIVENVENFTKRRSNNKYELHRLKEILESSIEMAKPRWKNSYESRGIKLELIKNLNSKSYIYCKAHEIREVILNIILNAMDAMEAGGILTIDSYDKDNKAIIEIKDTGEGMTEDVKERIFESFFSTKDVRGTGLGLSISKDIIERHNGEIVVESELGRGTKFIIKLDSHLKDNKAKVGSIDIPKFNNVSALIIDDNREVAYSIGQLMNMLKINNDIETDVDKVMDKIDNNDYDIIVCDLAMPRIGGLDIAKKVKDKYPNTKFIIMTGWPGEIGSKYLDKVDYILEKPCLLKDLAEGIDLVINNKE
ncbi:ATP-binding protein [Dethiothermospora halolimnae]|uniref:sensor histidine kinase n=1 Tax=Dethiothermospora halolimnae TaxID=3114390 RepID=UPI003CCB88D2